MVLLLKSILSCRIALVAMFPRLLNGLIKVVIEQFSEKVENAVWKAIGLILVKVKRTNSHYTMRMCGGLRVFPFQYSMC